MVSLSNDASRICVWKRDAAASREALSADAAALSNEATVSALLPPPPLPLLLLLDIDVAEQRDHAALSVVL